MIATKMANSDDAAGALAPAADIGSTPDLGPGLPTDRVGLLQVVRTEFPELLAEDAFEMPTWFPRQKKWVEDPIGSESVVYNFPLMLRIRGALDQGALQTSLERIVRRHGVFRSVFRLIGGRLIQIVLAPTEFSLPVLHLGGSPEEREVQMQDFARAQAIQPFDLTRDPILRCHLIRLEADNWVLVLVTHTLVFDDWSSGVMIHELSETYSAVAAGNVPVEIDLKFQFGDFARWQRQRLEGSELEPHLDFWRQQLNSSNGFEHLAPDFPRPAKNSYSGAKHTVILPDAQVESLVALSRQEHVSPFMVLLAGFKCLLHHYSGDEEIGIASCAANRQLEEVEGLIGRFGNSTLLRTSLAGNPTFSDLFRRVQEVTLEALSHLEVPFGRLLEEIAPAGGLGRSRPFQMMFILQNAPKEKWQLPGLNVQWAPLETATAKLDLIVWLKTEPKLEITLEYATQVFAPGSMSKLMQDYQAILETMARDPQRRISDTPVSARREPVITKAIVTPIRGAALAMDRAGVENQMIELWKNVFKPRPVDVTKNFFELGGDSLLAVRLFAQINKTFQCRMPLSVLLGAPTIDQLVQILFDHAPVSSSSLVPIQPAGKKPPLFFIHGSGGEPAGALELSRCLGPDQPVYGLRSRALCGEPGQRSIPEIADYYVKSIQGVQPKGPYYLSGFCFGGLVAYEMAKLLKAQGEEIAMLAIFDSPAPGMLQPMDCVRNRIRHDWWKLRRAELPHSFPILAIRSRRAARVALRFVKVAIWSLAGKSPDKNARDIEQEILDVSDTNISAAKAYAPGVYSGPITLFMTPEALALYGHDLYERWQAFGTGAVDLHFTGDEHLKQLEPPFIQALAEKLQQCLAQPGESKPGALSRPAQGAAEHARSPQRRKLPSVLAKFI